MAESIVLDIKQKETNKRMTNITNTQAGSNDTPNHKMMKFRIAIKQPEDWKIQSIAKFKHQQKLRKHAEELLRQKLQLQSEAEEKKKNSKKEATSNPQVEKQDAAEKEQKEIEQKNLIYEASVRELANCHITSTIIKSRIAQLHTLRMSMLWLLKKTSLHERALINDHLAPQNST
jgi:hypothetical protein